MDIITEKSEEKLADLLPTIQQDAENWVCVHVRLTPVHEETLVAEGISSLALARIRKASIVMAQKLHGLGLKEAEGSIFVFEDSDVLALIHGQEQEMAPLVEKLRWEFVSSGLGHLFASYNMRDRLAQLVSISEDKQASAVDCRLRNQAVKVADTIFGSDQPQRDMAIAIQKKRRQRIGGGTVLIIEDDMIARGLLASSLGKEYQVVQAKDAKSGVIAYIDSAPNMVLLDLHLPDHEGGKVLHALRLLDPHAYVIVVSADSIADNVLAVRAEGAAGFIKKPFTPEKLRQYIQKCPTLGKHAVMDNMGWSRVQKLVKHMPT